MDLQWVSLSLLGSVVDCRLGRICGRGWPSLCRQERDSVGVDRFKLNEELMLGHVDTLYLSSTGEPNRERRPVAGGSTVCSMQVRASLWCSERKVFQRWKWDSNSGISPLWACQRYARWTGRIIPFVGVAISRQSTTHHTKMYEKVYEINRNARRNLLIIPFFVNFKAS